MVNSRLALGVLAAWLATPCEAACADLASAIKVDQVVMCAAIKDRSAAGVADTFPSGIYSVYCYTRLTGSQAATVTHEWYCGASKVATMKLRVGSLPWRTWSFKEMKKDSKGDWRVDVVGPDGAVLASKKFFLK